MGGRAITQRLDHDGPIALRHQWPGNFAITERSPEDPGNEHDRVSLPHARGPESLTLPHLDVANDGTIDWAGEESESEE
jgi:hypothetical protein